MAENPIKVVYVEDEPAVAELLRSGLDLFGVHVDPIYDTAEEAFDRIIRDEVLMAEADIFVFDIRLPGMTGLELASRLRDSGESRPILIVSAYQPPPRSQMEELDAHFMPKPFDFPGIYNKIRELLS